MSVDLFEADADTVRKPQIAQEDLFRLDEEIDLPREILIRLNRLCPLDDKEDDGPFNPRAFLQRRATIREVLLATDVDPDDADDLLIG